MRESYQLKRCQTFIRSSEGTEIQCQRIGYRRMIGGKKYWLCVGHLVMILGLPVLRLSKDRCFAFLTAVFGAWSWGGTVNYAKIQHEVRFEIRCLGPREQHAIARRFGFDGNKPAPYREVGELLGVTTERARQIEQKALRRLRHPSRLGSLPTRTS